MEIDLLRRYPKTTRDVKSRGETKTPIDQSIARRFDKDFFDGSRRFGYGGYSYHEKYWSDVVIDFCSHWNLEDGDSLLDVGCGKGFMLFEFQRYLPGLEIAGIDISSYAIENAMDQVKNKLVIANANRLPFATKSFDYVISINTIHNLPIEQCIDAIREIERVSRISSFVVVDAYESDEQKDLMYKWNLTAQTILSKDQWRELFLQVGYTGDYYWFTP